MIFTVSTRQKQELIDITDHIESLVTKSKIKDGIVSVYALHATAAIIINENYDPNICLDFLDAINRCIPEKAGYRHDSIDGNAAAHIKAGMLGPSETIPLKDGKLLLGTWQSIMLVELDGPKSKRNINVEIISCR